MRSIPPLALLVSVALIVSGCTSNPPLRGSIAVNDLTRVRGAPAVAWPSDTQAHPSTAIAEPLTVRRAVEIAFVRSPAVGELYAELGLSQAEVLASSRLPNPTFGYVGLSAGSGGPSQITRSISLGFTDLLMMPSRSRIASANFDTTRQRVAGRLLDLQAKVESVWYDYVAALQSEQMRAAAARAASASAEYAKRLNAAGNIRPRALALELAAASEAQIAAARAHAEVARSRAAFARVVGLSTRDDWQVARGLPALPASSELPANLADQALTARLDVLAARREVDTFESGLRLTRWWRWLGNFEIGYERESETDGSHLRGPTFSLGIPLFNQNQSGVLHAQAELDRSRARLAELELGVRNEIALGLDRLATTREVAESYRAALVPQREAMTSRTLEEVSFMLSGAFELLQAKREQFEAYQEYVDAVRDYWLARVELRRASGGKLVDDDAASTTLLELGETVPSPMAEMPGERK
jgi:cobalt-zinc-cadmium efflux system outer membrane protein